MKIGNIQNHIILIYFYVLYGNSQGGIISQNPWATQGQQEHFVFNNSWATHGQHRGHGAF